MIEKALLKPLLNHFLINFYKPLTRFEIYCNSC